MRSLGCLVIIIVVLLIAAPTVTFDLLGAMWALAGELAALLAQILQALAGAVHDLRAAAR